MKKELVTRLHNQFESAVQNDKGIEFWYARDLQILLGYEKWENFLKVIEKGRQACLNSKQSISDHMPDVRHMIPVGKGAQREVDDVKLTRYACYLIAQNGDPRKTEIAFAQTYFAIQTRKQEIIEKRLTEMERLQRKIYPEKLPPAEDIKKVERKINSESKKLPDTTKGLKD